MLQTGNGIGIGGGYTQPGSGIVLFNSGSNVSYNNTIVAKLTDNSATSGQLTITFNASASSAAVNTVLSNIAYSNRSDSYQTTTSKTILVTFNDGSSSNVNNVQGGASRAATAEISVSITPTNDAPTFGSALEIAATEDSATSSPVTPATVSALLGSRYVDPDGMLLAANPMAGVAIGAYSNGSLNGSSLGTWQVYLGSAWVNLSDLNSAVAGGITTARALLLSADTQIQFLKNSNANTSGAATVKPSLSVYAVETTAFNATVTNPSAFTSVAGSPVTYDTTADLAGSRVAIEPVLVTVAIAAVNDAPTLTATLLSTVAESNVTGTGTDAVALLTGVSVADLDLSTTGALTSTVFGAGSITVALTDRTTSDVFTLDGSLSRAQGVDTTSGGSASSGSYVIQLTTGATVAQVQTILAAIRFQNTSDTPSTSPRNYTVTFSDGSNRNAASATAGGSALTYVSSGTLTIGAGNDAPVMSGGGAALAYTESDAATVIDATVTVASDADDTQMASATVTISAGYTTGDVLSVTAQNGISGSYDATTHVLTLTGPATLANFTTALQSVKFNSTAADPTVTSSSRTISWQVTDANSANVGAKTSNTLTSTISITAINAAPTLTGTGTASYTENGTAAVLFSGITVADTDDTQIVSAAVSIGTGFTGGDTLNFSDQNSISGTYHSDTGILNLSGTASLANYQTALASITFTSSSDDPTVNTTATTRTLHWTVTDANSEGKGAQSSADKTSS